MQYAKKAGYHMEAKYTMEFENCASHSRYFSDELDAQNFYQKGNKCLMYSYAYGILFL